MSLPFLSLNGFFASRRVCSTVTVAVAKSPKCSSVSKAAIDISEKRPVSSKTSFCWNEKAQILVCKPFCYKARFAKEVKSYANFLVVDRKFHG